MNFSKIFILIWVVSIIVSVLTMVIMTAVLSYQIRKEKSFDIRAKYFRPFQNTFNNRMIWLILLTPIANLYSTFRLVSRFDKIKEKSFKDIDMQ